MARGALALPVLLLAAALIGAPSVAAADPVTFGTPTATSSFGKSLVFEQPATISGTPKRIEILITTPGAIGPEVVPLPGVAAVGPTLTYTMDLANGGVVPNTTFTARWRVVDSTGTAWLGPTVSMSVRSSVAAPHAGRRKTAKPLSAAGSLPTTPKNCSS